MKLGKFSIPFASIVVLAVQLALVCSIAAKYLYQRSTCPHVWVRTVAVDPEGVMRGRYLALQLVVDACQSTLPSAKMAKMPHNLEGVPVGNTYRVQSQFPVSFPARLSVQNNKLVAIRIPDSGDPSRGQWIQTQPGLPCDSLYLLDSVDFYLPEHAALPWAASPMSVREIWVEVTVPPKGPPRPIQLALKDNGVWKPVAFQ
jgi:uncharacterized membrane-anchored protein